MTWDPPTIAPAPESNRRVGLIIAGGVLFLAVVVGAIANGGGGGGSASVNDDREFAIEACHQFTRDDLKAPATADFPFYTDEGVSARATGETMWTVRSYVDAENSFGANIRTSFECRVERVPEGWRLVDWSER